MSHQPARPSPSAESIPVAKFAAGPKIREWARKHRFADWRVARFVRLVEDSSPFLDGLLQRPPRYVRTNPLKAPAGIIQERLQAKGFKLSRNDLDPNVFRIRDAPLSIGATVEHMLGMTMPQDLASASAPVALGTRTGDIVADLAAAPGVKTVHIAGDLGARGAVVAVEPDASRLRALRFNLERCGVASAVVRQERAQETPGEGWADRVLLDAPCTGEGTLPKDPNRRMGKPEEIAQLCALQIELVDAADRMLRPGGTFVYATCTFGPEENEAQVQRLIDRGYRMEKLPFDHVAGRPLLPGVTQWPGLKLSPEVSQARRFIPGIHPTLGFFVAKLTKGGAQ